MAHLLLGLLAGARCTGGDAAAASSELSTLQQQAATGTSDTMSSSQPPENPAIAVMALTRDTKKQMTTHQWRNPSKNTEPTSDQSGTQTQLCLSYHTSCCLRDAST